jgi:hypothetical protein
VSGTCSTVSTPRSSLDGIPDDFFRSAPLTLPAWWLRFGRFGVREPDTGWAHRNSTILPARTGSREAP